jgi:hypothetical protein
VEYPCAREEINVLFPEDVCDPNSWFRFGKYGVHLQAGTWRRRAGLLRRVLQRRWEVETRKAFLKESLKRGGKRSLEFSKPKVRSGRRLLLSDAPAETTTSDVYEKQSREA